MTKIHLITDQDILDYIRQYPNLSSKDIHAGLGEVASFATIKRKLGSLLTKHQISATGNGKATRYFITPGSTLLAPIDVDAYFQKEIDDRKIFAEFNFALIPQLQMRNNLFFDTEIEMLESLQKKFEKNIAGLSSNEYNKEFERLAIDLSWKSSQIEGNTYSLLETERLLKEQETAIGKKKDEATMLLNHKAALDFILEHTNYIQPLSLQSIEDIHSMLIENLGVQRNIRNRRVGISGTNYRPLDNEFQLRDVLVEMTNLINLKTNVFEKALLALSLISYIQPFADGNKRTARIISNAILMYHRYCPISFRTVDAIEYKKAMLVFYEQNNITAIKKIFIEQYEFAVKTYF
ncbi:MAG TPA: Fic family protein [Chitinophagales bacterium]|nr:Fic family protein [Chitinophagales bacterium]HRG27970.1 Fic family protein [Chitinophagales bacterium]HRG86108.1 Fic family protein [Chitinophagales bacterium]HRH54129.1 Fic family protein [Chitinophagales bacterium]